MWRYLQVKCERTICCGVCRLLLLYIFAILPQREFALYIFYWFFKLNGIGKNPIPYTFLGPLRWVVLNTIDYFHTSYNR